MPSVLFHEVLSSALFIAQHQTVITIISADPPQVVNTGVFAGHENVVVILDSQFIEINYYISDPSNVDLPALPPLKHSSIFFTGQDKYLQKLKDHFTSNVGGERIVFLLHGLGGIGKTQICLKFIEENPDLFSDIFWIDASSEKSVEFVLTQISSTYSTSPDGRPSARSALEWISQRSNFFIMYDGADGHYSVIEKFLPPGNGGNVMITSRNIGLKRLSALSKNSMEMYGMEDEDAICLLLKSAMLDDTNDDIYNLAQQLVLQLDKIPLAIDQAGAYMHSCGCSINDYLELFTRYKNELMRNTPGFEGASDYGTSTYGTWDISMKEMEGIDANDSSQESVAAQSATKLLRIFALLDHADIPQELFKGAAENYMKRQMDDHMYLLSSLSLLDDETVFMGKHGEWDKLKFLDGIQVLLSFSLVRSHNHMYSMHLLVSAWSRNSIPKAEVNDLYYIARALLSCSIALDWKTDNYEFCQSLAPHIRSNILHGLELKLNSKYYDDQYTRFALVFDHVGSWDEEEQLLHIAVHQRKTELGLDHLYTLVSMANLALTYRNQGRWDEAGRLQMNVLNAFKPKFGSDHPFTLTSMSNLALTYKKQGRWDEAEQLEMDVMNAFNTKFGPDHTSTLTSMANLASTYRNQGRWDDAEKLEMDVMNRFGTKLGSDHPSSLTSIANLASTFWNQGRWDEAEKLQMDVMNTRKAKLGSYHPDTLTS
ncbi:P-loop containing nucleoside triphosphate hydrolase protein, partial [Amanita rubescens]